MVAKRPGFWTSPHSLPAMELVTRHGTFWVSVHLHVETQVRISGLEIRFFFSNFASDRKLQMIENFIQTDKEDTGSWN